MQAKEVTGKATGVRGGKGAQQTVETSKRERVLDVAERLFAEGGFDGVSMAFRCGILRRRQTLACR